MIRSLIFILIFFALVFELQAQNLKSEQIDMITKNILSYHFRYALNYDLNLKSDKVLQGDDYFFNELWPREDQNLKLDILSTEFKYPLEAITVFEIRKRGFQIGNDSVRISMKLTSFQADDVYLVAVDPSSKDLRFISGNFFQSSIKDDFDLNIELPETFIEYLAYRTFNWSTEKIRYKKTKKDILIFNAYSQYLKGEIQIEVDKSDFDQVSVQERKKRVTY